MEKIDSLEYGQCTVEDFVRQAFADKKAAEYLDNIKCRQKLLEEELKTAVCENSNELLENASDVKVLRDNVIELRNRVSATKIETQNISDALLIPFHEIQDITRYLDANHELCTKIRLLLRFLSLVRQVQRIQTVRLNASSEVRRICELQKLADDGNLKEIIIFQQHWATIRPTCENLISLAKTTITTFLSQPDSSKITDLRNALIVFDQLGKLSNILKTCFNSLLESTLSHANGRFDDILSDEIASKLNEEIQEFSGKLLVVSLLSNTAENILPGVSIKNDVSPEFFSQKYSSFLKQTLENLVRQDSEFLRFIFKAIPSIRQKIISNSFFSSSFSFLSASNLDPKLIQTTFLSKPNGVLSSFQEEFLIQSVLSIRDTFGSIFKTAESGKDRKPVDYSLQIRQETEKLENVLNKYDRAFARRFKSPLKKLSEDLLKGFTPKRKEMIVLFQTLEKSFEGLAVRVFGEGTDEEFKPIFANLN